MSAVRTLGFFFLLSIDFNILKTRSESLSHKVSQTQDWNPVVTELMRADRCLVILLLTGLP